MAPAKTAGAIAGKITRLNVIIEEAPKLLAALIKVISKFLSAALATIMT